MSAKKSGGGANDVLKETYVLGIDTAIYASLPAAGYGFLRVGSPGASQSVRVGSSSAAPRILIPTGA